MAQLNSNKQKITFCGVGAHRQNGIVEQRIWNVTKIARTILLNYQRYWTECVEKILWLFAVKVAIEILYLDGNTPTAKLYNIKNINPMPTNITHLDVQFMF